MGAVMNEIILNVISSVRSEYIGNVAVLSNKHIIHVCDKSRYDIVIIFNSSNDEVLVASMIREKIKDMQLKSISTGVRMKPEEIKDEIRLMLDGHFNYQIFEGREYV